MSKDALIESAISHWAPRMVSNGIMLTDFQEVTASINVLYAAAEKALEGTAGSDADKIAKGEMAAP